MNKYNIYIPWPYHIPRISENKQLYEACEKHKQINLVNSFDEADYIIYTNCIKIIYYLLQDKNKYGIHDLYFKNKKNHHLKLKPNMELLKKIALYKKYNKEIIIDFNDSQNHLYSNILDDYNNVFLFFKRSIVNKKKFIYIKYPKRINNTVIKEVIPMSQALTLPYIKLINNNLERIFDISCMFKFNISSLEGMRYQIVRQLKKERLYKKYNIFIGEIDKDKNNFYSNAVNKYMEQMQKSKIVITCCKNTKWKGEGDYRFFESFSSGALVFSYKMMTPIKNPFINKKHVIYFTNVRELEKLINYYLKKENENERLKIAKNGHNHCLKYHTMYSRIDQIIEEIEK